MPKPRKRQVSLNDTPYYHCIARCVRRAFLCGKDPLTGCDFEHRRQWLVDRMKRLADVFAIDLCAYAVMSNHYHLVLRIDQQQAADWYNREVVERWLRLFSGPDLARRWLEFDSLSDTEYHRLETLIKTWRQRLFDLSWFMRCLNEPIARMANQEDHCTGRFWEGRFKSQALLDERALLACMAYVDLNPVRAGMATTPESSEYTSIRERVHAPESQLLSFVGQYPEQHSLPFRFEHYLELVDWAARRMQSGKKGRISAQEPPILQRLSMNPDSVFDFLVKKPDLRFSALGPAHRLRAFARSVGAKFVHGLGLAEGLCPQPR
ncbi:MAG: hypothetical protein V2I48_07415 [Xanthomonadales bacterium]|jgi:REP element-mobilizing transposase RayT|nr:hypothetical protein [Xanthomonadales bacterium]